MLANIKSYLIVSFVVTLILAASHAYIYKMGKDANQAEHDKQEIIITKVREQAILGAADAIAKIEIKNTTVNNEVQREIRTNTVYRECVHTDAGLRIVNDALSPPNGP